MRESSVEGGAALDFWGACFAGSLAAARVPFAAPKKEEAEVLLTAFGFAGATVGLLAAMRGPDEEATPAATAAATGMGAVASEMLTSSRCT